MLVKYTGPFDAVEVDGLAFAVVRDEPFEVSDDLAVLLLEQADNYVAATTSAPARRRSGTTPEGDQ